MCHNIDFHDCDEVGLLRLATKRAKTALGFDEHRSTSKSCLSKSYVATHPSISYCHTFVEAVLDKNVVKPVFKE